MLSESTIQTIFTHFNLGPVSHWECREDETFEDYRILIPTETYALMPIAKPFRIGGGLHLQLYETHAESFIGSCALYVMRKPHGRMTLPKIPADGRYWAIFKAVAKSANLVGEHTFISFRGGQKFKSTVTLDEKGYVAAVHETEIKPTDRKYWIFYDPVIEPELHQVGESH